ncbi:ATP-grasp domain-containing protein [Bacillus sp. FJAT-27251]|uniref:ATP-grasp domain-containing protein n=1 Tax=Bacillus sp. FJAT-27251 TaxID=1684142 RepID=UPI0006A7CB6A|nr:ATP-grasp domain-containing protein [Bacillus sp. FJAT-27251]
MKQLAYAKTSIPNTLRPSHTIESLYGQGYIYNPKLYSEDYSHFSSDVLSLEALTGRELSVAGDAPVICHVGTVTEPALRLLRKAGLTVPASLYTYSSEEDYLALLHQLEYLNKKVIFQYPHPAEKASPELHWVDPDVHAYLCDKRSIPDLVPAGHYPQRKMMSLAEILQEKPQLPLVLKSGDGRPTSGGCGVMLVHDEHQLNSVDETFCDLSKIIVEEHIEYDENISVHYAVNPDGEIRFLGRSEQIVNQEGCFRGSWISVDIDDKIAPIAETGYWVMKRIADTGYVGVAGFDVLVKGDSFYFIDLNVRFNASTCGLLLYRDIQRNYGKSVMRLCNLEWTSSFDDLVPVVENYMDSGKFVPIGFLDADYVPCGSSTSKAVGLVIAHSTEEAETTLTQMALDGLHPRE